jgi:hypothetical protein
MGVAWWAPGFLRFPRLVEMTRWYAAAGALVVLVLSGCGGTGAGTSTLTHFRHCVAKDDHFAVFIDGASTGSDFALGSLPREARQQSFIALVSGLQGQTASRRGVVFVLLWERSYTEAVKWGAHLAAYKVSGYDGNLRPRRGRGAYAWMIGRVNVGRVTGPSSPTKRKARAQWIKRWGQTNKYAGRVWLHCVGLKLRPNSPPPPTS